MRFTIFFVLLLFVFRGHSQIYTSISGNIHFISNAPLEVIEAESNELQGLLDFTNKKFAFKLYIKSFEGFNSSMQQIHFYENYMETELYPISTFKGKILEPISLGEKEYRAKGSLEIHGETVERIILVKLNVTPEFVEFHSEFIVPLEDHNIYLPRLVYQKIAEDIEVTVKGKMIIRE